MPKYCPLLTACLMLCACGEHNPYFCKGAPLDNCTLIDAAPDGPMHCTTSQECTLPTATVCDTQGSGTCVECTSSESAACTGVTPACVSNTCQKCTQHSQCSSAACLPDGTCGNDTNVAYVDPAGTDTQTCSKASPCTDVAKALATARPYVKFHGTTDQPVSVNAGRVVTFLADSGASLTRTTGGGAILTVQDDGTSLTVYDLSINNAPNGPSGIGCLIPTGGGAPTLALHRVTISSNPGGGISAAGGTLAVSQSSLGQNLGGGIAVAGGTLTVTQSELNQNTGGGILMSVVGVVNLSNNFIHHNGNDIDASFGGLSLRPAAGSMVQFNTIIDNKANLGAASAGGVFCDVAGFVADNNIIFRNTGGQATSTQVFGNCMYGKSFVAAAPAADNTPMFVHPNTPPFDYRLTSSTPATIRDVAGNCTGVDHDGDVRPFGSGCDLGADEYHP